MKRTRTPITSVATPLVPLLAVLLAASGCGSGDNEAARPAAGKTSVASPTTSTATVDACKVLAAADVQPHLGTTDAGRPSYGVGESVCEWRNAGTEESVTLSIGAKGTAASGRLDPTSPYGETEPVPELGETARFRAGVNIVEFVAGDRECEVQVAVLDADKARRGAVALARLARDRI